MNINFEHDEKLYLREDQNLYNFWRGYQEKIKAGLVMEKLVLTDRWNYHHVSIRWVKKKWWEFWK